jgi:hypothetical protein
MSNIKCPNCKAELPSSSTTCEWCSFVIDRSGEDSIEQINAAILQHIKEAKQLPKHNFFSILRKNAKFSMTTFAVASFVLAYKINWVFALLGLLFLAFAFVSLFRKTDQSDLQLQKLNGDFEADILKLNKLYGANSKIAQQVIQYNKDWRAILDNRNKIKKLEWASYIVIASLLVLAFSLPTAKTKQELKQELGVAEIEIMQQVESAIQSNKIADAENLLLQLKSPENITKVKSMLSLNKMELKLAKVVSDIKAENFEQAQQTLKSLKWVKTSTDYDMELIEETYFKQFIYRKNEVIQMLPERYRIQPEDELAF